MHRNISDISISDAAELAAQKGLKTHGLGAVSSSTAPSVPTSLANLIIYQTDQALTANVPHALSAGDKREDSSSDDVAEDVWGYLLPLNSQHSTLIPLKNRNTRPIAKTEKLYEIGNLQHADRNAGSIAGRYLVGRHPECGE